MKHTGMSLSAAAVMAGGFLAGPAVRADAVITKTAFVQMLLTSASVNPDPSGKSPYVDVSTKSVAWGYVHRALELGVVSPDAPKRFGANDPVSPAMAAQMAAKLYHMDLGGQSPWVWAEQQGLLRFGNSLSQNRGARIRHRAEAARGEPRGHPWILDPTRR